MLIQLVVADLFARRRGKSVFRIVFDHQNAFAAAAVCRFNHEFLIVLNDVENVFDFVLIFNNTD